VSGALNEKLKDLSGLAKAGRDPAAVPIERKK
jgi:hypothetical protein